MQVDKLNTEEVNNVCTIIHALSALNGSRGFSLISSDKFIDAATRAVCKKIIQLLDPPLTFDKD